jgi:hypothetical protein
MDNNESDVLRELKEVRAEVRRLRRTVLFGFIAIAAVTVWIVPNTMPILIGVWIVYALIFQPKSFLIFPSKQDGHKNDA